MTLKHLNFEISELKFKEDYEYKDKIEQKIIKKVLPKILEKVI